MKNFIQNTIACLKNSKWFITAVLLLVCMTSYAQLPWLHVEGNQIKDENGNNVTLRGVSILPPEHNNECITCNRKPISEMLTWTADAEQGWHSRVVRLQVTTAKLGDPKTSFETVIDPYVQMATEKGLYVIVDLHFVSDYGTSGVSQSFVMEFWNYVAPKYANNPNVLFEVYNEPIYPDNWTTWKNYIQPVVTSIRSVAPDNLILVGGPSWSTRVNEAAADPLVGDNLVYVYHIYPNQGQATAANLDNLFGNAAQTIPVMITEFGWNQSVAYSNTVTRGATGTWGDPFRQYIDAHPNISWTSYIFDNYYMPQYFDESWNLLSGDDQGAFMQEWFADTKDSHQPEVNNLSAFGVTDSQIDLKWPISSSAISYNVKRSQTSGGPYTTVAQISATNFSDTALSGETTYYYVVSENSASGEGSNSTEVSATTSPMGFAPDVPMRLKAEGGDGVINLTWTESAGATSYNIHRSQTSGGSYTTIASGVTGGSYTDSNVANGEQYFYKVSAVGGLESSPSVEVSDIPASVVLIMDNPDAATVGTWTSSTGAPGFYGTDYLHDGNTGSVGGKRATYTPAFTQSGNYLVSFYWTSAPNRASNVPVQINHANGTSNLVISQQGNGAMWVPLGTYEFNSGQSASIVISNDGTNGYVVADAIKFSLSNGELSNESPVANFTYSANAFDVSFDASSSSDSDGTIVSYEWDFGDGTQGSGLTPSHTYPDTGQFVVTLTVTDDKGDPGTYMETITVNDGSNQSPVASFTYSSSGTTINFDGSNSTDTDGTIVSYSWDFGDGTFGAGQTVSHTYSNVGDYTVTLSVTDDSSATDYYSEVISVIQGQVTTVNLNQQQNGGVMNVVGTFPFEAGSTGWVKIRTDATNGYVIADAVKFSKSGQSDIILDSEHTTGISIVGAWSTSSASSGYVGSGYLHDQNQGKGANSVTYAPSLPVSGDWTVSIQWTTDPNRATNVPVDIHHAVQGTATSMHVESIAKSSNSVGQGNKQGVVTVTILDDLGYPVTNATVSGTFSGSFNETQSAVTDLAGVATINTTGVTKGNVSFEFCVDDIVHSQLTYASEENVVTCSNESGARMSAEGQLLEQELIFAIFPNPVTDGKLSIRYTEASEGALIRIMSLAGKTVMAVPVREQETVIEMSSLRRGIYVVQVEKNGEVITNRRIINR